MKIKSLFVGAGLCLIAAMAIGWADRYVLRAAAKAAAARTPGLSVGDVVAEPWRGAASLQGLDFRRNGAALHIDTLTIAAPVFVPLIGAALAGMGAASAENITLEAGTATYRIKRIDVAGASLPIADLMQLVERSAASPAERLAQLSAATITLPETTIENRAGASTQTIVYRDITLSGIAAGIVARAAVGESEFTSADDASGLMKGAFGKLTATELDLPLAAQIATGTRAGDGAMRPLCAAFAVDGVRLEGAQHALAIGHAAATALSGRPPIQPWRDAAVAAQQPSIPPQRAALAIALLQSFAAAELKISDFSLDIRDDGKAARLAVAQASATQIEALRIKAVEGRALALERPSGLITLDSVSLRGLDLGPLLDGSRMPNSLGADFRPDFEGFAFTKMKARFAPAAEQQLDAGYGVERFEITSPTTKDATAEGVSISVDHFITPVAAGGLPQLAAMGYSQLDLSGRMNVLWSEATRDLSIRSFLLEGVDMGSLRAAAEFSNVTAELASRDEAIAAAAARIVRLNRFNLDIENSGLFDRALALQAQNEKLPIEQIRESMIRKANLLLPVLLGTEPSALALGAAIEKFLAAPNILRLQTSAPAGVGVTDLELVQTPGVLLKKLELTAAANP